MKHTKQLVSVLLALLLAVGLCLPAIAEDSHVQYVGDAEKFIFSPGSSHSPSDLFGNFKGVMPGDSLSQPILVKNDAKNKVKIKVYLRSLGATPETEEFLSQMTLTVKQDGNSNLFAAPANETAQLTDWVCLGTVYSGGDIRLDVTLDVPLSMDNTYQNAVGYLDWEFKVEELPVSPDDPTPPKTGDEVIALWLGLTAIAAAVVVVLFVAGKKRKQEAE